jgi:hypothetical protein
MFVVAQLPVSDLRGLVPGEMARLRKPNWDAVDPGALFMRGFGPIATRNASSLGMAGEHFFADFDRTAIFKSRLANLPIELKPWFRRFYFDGQIAGRFEFGFMSVDIRTGDDIPVDPSEIADAIAELELEISIADTIPLRTSLAESGEPLGLALLAATTERSRLSEFPIAETYGLQLEIGDPTFHIRLVPGEAASSGRDSRRDTEEQFGLWVTSSGKVRRQNVIVQRSEYGTLDEPSPERAVRVIFAHLNSFIFALSHLVRTREVAGARIDEELARSVVPKLVERLSSYSPSGPTANGDELLAAALRAFGETYRGKSETLVETLGAYLTELNKPTATRNLANYTKSLIDLVITTAVKAGVEATVKKYG